MSQQKQSHLSIPWLHDVFLSVFESLSKIELNKMHLSDEHLSKFKTILLHVIISSSKETDTQVVVRALLY